MSKKRTIINWKLVFPATVFFLAIILNFLINSVPLSTTKVLGVSTKLQKEEILRLLNLERGKKGFGPLVFHEQLNQAAQVKGENMFATNYWAHVSPQGVQPWSFISQAGYIYQSAGENLGRDFQNEASLVAAWMNSATHRANILNGNFSDIGLAILDGEINGEPVLLIVNFFAQPKLSAQHNREVAIYDHQSDSLVLAGEVMPESELLANKNSWFGTRIKKSFIILIFLIVGLIVFNLKGNSYKKRK